MLPLLLLIHFQFMIADFWCSLANILGVISSKKLITAFQTCLSSFVHNEHIRVKIMQTSKQEVQGRTNHLLPLI
jgi:hypothetical protein